jgi:hypothetical protein
MAHDLASFAAHLMAVAVESEVLKHELLDEACKLVENEAKRVIGTYEYGWPQLAESTQADRERHGFAPNEPLLRTGGMRESIEHTVHGTDGFVGSNDPKAKWQELGTSRGIPPRSFLGGAAAHEGPKIADLVGRTYSAVLLGGALPDKIK